MAPASNVAAHENLTLTNGQGFAEGEAPAESRASANREGEAARPDSEYSVLSTEYTVPESAAPDSAVAPASNVAAHENLTLTDGQGFEEREARGTPGPSRREGPTLPTRLERRLASGRRMTDRERRRLEGLIERREKASN